MEILVTKLAALIVYPFGLLTCLLLATTWLLVARRLRAARILVLSALILVFTAGNDRVAYWLLHSLENDYPAPVLAEVPDSDVIVVLGGGLDPPYPPRRHPHLRSGSDRLLYALRLYRANKAHHILLTGGNVFAQPGLETEAFYARELLATWGVPESAMVLETDSRNTRQNARYSKPILEARGWDRILLVTSASHMRRAVLAFRRAGVTVTPAPTDFLAVEAQQPQALNWLPNIRALSETTHALHEYLGRLWYRMNP